MLAKIPEPISVDKKPPSLGLEAVKESKPVKALREYPLETIRAIALNVVRVGVGSIRGHPFYQRIFPPIPVTHRANVVP